MSRSVQPTNYRRNPMPLSEVLAETFRHTQRPEDLTAWADAAPMPGQLELPLECGNCGDWCPGCNKTPAQGPRFCDEVNSEFTSTARPGADWGTWNMP